MEKIYIKGFVLLFIFSLAGCKEPYIPIAAANNDVRRGLYQQALAAYLNEMEDTRYKSAIQYNLGIVYFYIGETDRALEMWLKGFRSSIAEVQYRSAFNRGVLLYERGRYREATDAFLSALKLFPRRLEARINMEYCVRQLEVETPQKKEIEEGTTKQTEILMQIIQNEAKKTWEKGLPKDIEDTETKDW